ncbi:uncharacterized protein [Epargyreus clarus]|uniref:uncharacterized protein n=1 Tax=Epargyreus clarus TaxID=520877 RepID=UPI003C2C2F74
MEKEEDALIERNGFTKLLTNIHITVLDLSHRSIANIDNTNFPPNLIELNLSHNELVCVPPPILDLKCVKILDLSFNNIKYFDESPAFCHTIEKLNLAYNELCGPPYWVWVENPKNLQELDISCNRNIKKSLNDAYFNELLQYKTSLSIIKLCSCNLSTHYELLGTFHKAKTLDLSTKNLLLSNVMKQVPCIGLDKCCDIERLNLSQTWICTITSNIDIYQNLKEINLSQNSLTDVPKEFCNLSNLEICILSSNSIMFLPDEIVRLKKLIILCLDFNKLCMLPENMHELPNLIKLDVYDNYLYDAPEKMEKLQEFDLAQNYFEEPDDEEYILKKKKLRLNLEERIDGRKFEILRPESAKSTTSTDEDLALTDNEISNIEENNDINNRELSSPEDWDSDEYWVPHFLCPTAPSQSPWLFFVKRKMAEGNFCPMDAHPIPVVEKVRYEKMCKPNYQYESDGQFDDYSSDDS